MLDPNASVVERLVSEFNSASATRGNFESHWEEVSRLALPAYSGTFNNGGNQITPGEKKTQSLYDSINASPKTNGAHGSRGGNTDQR